MANAPTSEQNEKRPPAERPEAKGENERAEQSSLNGSGGTSNSLAFLQAAYPDGPWWLVSFPQDDGKGHFAAFGPAGASECEAWIAKENAARRNVFYHVNRLEDGPARRAKKEDIAAVGFLHVDIDPAAGEDMAQERQRILSRLTANLPEGVPPPTFIVDSGNGYQALWRLRQPIPLGPDNPAESVERHNRWLEAQFRADSCHDVNRVLRVPATTNWPNAKKRAKGRVPSPAKVEGHAPTNVYDLSSFGTIEAAAGSGSADQRIAAKVDAANVRRFASLEDPVFAKVTGKGRVVIAQGLDPDEPTRFPGRSEWLFFACCEMVRGGCDDQTIYSVITDPDWKISESVLDKGGMVEKYARRQIERARAAEPKVDRSGGIFGPIDSTPKSDEQDEKPGMRDFARSLLHRRKLPLIRLNDEYHSWENGAYLSLEDNTIRSETYTFLESIRMKPKQGLVTNVLDALTSLVHLDRRRFVPPCWMKEREGLSPRDLLVCRNGLLHLPTGQLHPHDPEFLTHNSLDYDYEPSAPAPESWLTFLKQIWPEPEEADCIAALQQWFGYLLTPDTSQQKILVTVGPKRSGKGTVARILTSLLGQHNVCAPRLSQFGEAFGLQSVINKQVVLVSDLRLGNRVDKSAIAEALLAISGEDRINVARKHRDDWVGQLRARFVIMSNEPPVLPDPSGALPSRFVVLQMRQSFYGREDTTLTERLMAERPGILNWAIEGWHALKRAGRLQQPASSAETVKLIERGSSQILAFVEDCCELAAGVREFKDDLYGCFVAWARDQGIAHTPMKEQFGKDLLSAFCGKIRACKPRGGGKPKPAYEGVRLNAELRARLAAGPGEFAEACQQKDFPF